MGRRLWLARFPIETLVKARPLLSPPPQNFKALCLHYCNNNEIKIIFYLCVRPLTSEPIFFMALRTGSDDWQELLTKMGIPADSARTYAKTFAEESITKDSLTMIDWEVLKGLGVTTMGHALAILKLAKEQPLISDSYTKAPAVKLPQLHSGMTSQQFRKFRINWEVFVQMTNIPLHRPTSSYTTALMRLSRHRL